MKVLVINAGSSSVKYQLFDMGDESRLAKGIIDRIGMEGALLSHEPLARARVETRVVIPDYESAMELISKTLVHPDHGVIQSMDEISAVGHRVVHGGEEFVESVLITEEVEDAIERYFDLAPLHNPPNMEGIKACKKLLPGVPQVAVFDTAFHETIPQHAYLYAIPYELYEKHFIRRYGFHGTSHRYVAQRAAEMLNQPLETLKMVTCHLGNGCSMTAVKNGKSVDTSMGFTPLEGLVMGTRSGDIDPAIILYLISRLGMNPEEINTMLNKESGLLGLSGYKDMRDVQKSAAEGSQKARIALRIFAYRVRKYIGAYAAAMGGLDVIVFTAGIGENAATLRAEICEDLEFLGVEIDPERNRAVGKEATISSDASRVKVLIVPTDEELMIARDTTRIVRTVAPSS
jgi:acetate kinase